MTYRLEVLRRIGDDDIRRAFAVGLATATAGGLLLSVIWQLLPLVRSGPPGSRLVAPVLALTLILSVPAGPATAKLYRRLAFRTVATAGLISTLTLCAIEIPLLLAHLGIWALAAGYVAAAIVNVTYLMIAAGGLPLPSLRGPVWQFIRLSLPYQAPLMAQAAVGLIVPIFVASLLGARGVGFVAWATILATPVSTVVFTLESIVGPSLARMLRDDRDQSVRPKKRHLHPLPIRVMHWTNAVAILIMISSGWKIYNDDVIFGWLHFPDALTLGHWAQHGLQWHFFGMWILVLNGIAYLIYGLVTGRFRRMLFPISLRALLKDISDALHFRLAHDDPTRYNAVQRLLYVGILLVGVLIVMSGLVLWKPVQFSELAALFYNFQTARLVHFLCMTAIVLFLTVHVTLALIVPQTLVAMVTGGPVVDEARRTTPAPNPS